MVTKQYRNFRLKSPAMPVSWRWAPGKAHLALCLQHPAETDASVWNTETSRTKHFSPGGKSALCAHLCFVYLICFLFIVARDSDKVPRPRSICIQDLEFTLVNPKLCWQETGSSRAAVNIFVWALYHRGRRKPLFGTKQYQIVKQ